MDDELKNRRAKAVRTAIVLGLVALAFFVASFYFMTNR